MQTDYKKRININQVNKYLIEELKISDNQIDNLGIKIEKMNINNNISNKSLNINKINIIKGEINFNEEARNRNVDQTDLFLRDVNSYINDPYSFLSSRVYLYTFLNGKEEDLNQKDNNNDNVNNDDDLNINNSIDSNVMVSEVYYRYNEQRSLYYLILVNDVEEDNLDNGRNIINRIRSDLRESLGDNYRVNIIEAEDEYREVENIQSINDISTIKIAINRNENHN